MRSKNIKIIIAIVIIIVISLSATYAFLDFSVAKNTSSSQAGCFEVSYSGQAITNANIQSDADYTKGESSAIVLSKTSNCKIYSTADLYIHTDSTTTAPISDGALKYKLLKGTTVIEEGSITQTGDLKITTTPLVLTDTATTYYVYFWLDPTISNRTYHGKSYSGYIYATSTQSSTITS